MAIIAESRSASKPGSRPPVESRPTTRQKDRQDARKLAESAGQPRGDRDCQASELLSARQTPAESSPITRPEGKPGSRPSAESRPTTRQDAGNLREIAAGQPGAAEKRLCETDLALAMRVMEWGIRPI